MFSLEDSKFYDLPQLKSSRTTSFGYGNKTDISKQLLKTPAPGTYLLKSDFNENV
jgi:hypothetical protein